MLGSMFSALGAGLLAGAAVLFGHLGYDMACTTGHVSKGFGLGLVAAVCVALALILAFGT